MTHPLDKPRDFDMTPKKTTKRKPPLKAAPKTKPAKRAPKGAEGKFSGAPASKLIDKRIAELGDWRGETLAHMRALILASAPGITEEWKWSVPVWSKDGIICTGETYKNVVKLTFAKGASLPDPAGLFNAGFGGATRRAIDIPEGAKINERAFKALVKAALALNTGAAQKT